MSHHSTIKPTWLRPVLMGLASVIITFLALFVIGNLHSIVAYTDFNQTPLLKLRVLQLVIVVSMALSVYFLLEVLAHHKKLVIGAGVLALILSYALVMYTTPNDPRVAAVSNSYIYLGDYLRDVHGINIYHMDWGGWIVTFIPYLAVVLTAITVSMWQCVCCKKENK